jgi:hypothetical protein
VCVLSIDGGGAGFGAGTLGLTASDMRAANSGTRASRVPSSWIKTQPPPTIIAIAVHQAITSLARDTGPPILSPADSSN